MTIEELKDRTNVMAHSKVQLELDSEVSIVQHTKTFPKCYVGRNGKRNQQKLHIQVCGSLKTQRNQWCQG